MLRQYWHPEWKQHWEMHSTSAEEILFCKVICRILRNKETDHHTVHHSSVPSVFCCAWIFYYYNYLIDSLLPHSNLNWTEIGRIDNWWQTHPQLIHSTQTIYPSTTVHDLNKELPETSTQLKAAIKIDFQYRVRQRGSLLSHSVRTPFRFGTPNNYDTQNIGPPNML